MPSLDFSETIVAERIQMWEMNKQLMEQRGNARTLLRIADRYLLNNQHNEAKAYYEVAAKKGSIRAVITMANLIANRDFSLEKRFQEIKILLKEYERYIGGYKDLLPAYYYQYGSLSLVTRNLVTANQNYKEAIQQNCREAAFEYGEFLISMLNTCR